MSEYFPQHIIEKYSNHSHADIIECYENAAMDMLVGETYMFIWSSKVVHRDTMINNTTVHYSGQIASNTNDELFNELINEEIKGYFFLKSSHEYLCYRIISCTLISPRGKRGVPPKYELKIARMEPNTIVRSLYPDYYDNIYLHPSARIKLRSMADHGFIPHSFGNELSNGVFTGFEIINLSE
jgi:hypothetical protein